MLNTEIREVLERERRSQMRLRLAARDAGSPQEAMMYGRRIVGEPKKEVLDKLIARVRDL